MLPSQNKKILAGTKKEFDSFTNIFERFLAVSQLKSNNSALIKNDEVLTYKELADKAEFFSNALENLVLNKFVLKETISIYMKFLSNRIQ
ncbi:hypothetical protein [Bacillus cytotoxicus]|nr:hypothetical protein [Bacillus cytotoxicus]MDH2864237.1 hypothetical protein [Bacillus cytotoxicus]MDH2885205.1 hypothetical protein [Bacillus cytotoxicus]NZD32864.1 hypothetical protein [Bacillus cytotoxicus]HDR7212772.1 hypothetical protein [Bacillus cytotoxicus]